jgi:hypothetical protein
VLGRVGDEDRFKQQSLMLAVEVSLSPLKINFLGPRVGAIFCICDRSNFIFRATTYCLRGGIFSIENLQRLVKNTRIPLDLLPTYNSY